MEEGGGWGAYLNWWKRAVTRERGRSILELWYSKSCFRWGKHGDLEISMEICLIFLKMVLNLDQRVKHLLIKKTGGWGGSGLKDFLSPRRGGCVLIGRVLRKDLMQITIYHVFSLQLNGRHHDVKLSRFHPILTSTMTTKQRRNKSIGMYLHRLHLVKVSIFPASWQYLRH